MFSAVRLKAAQEHSSGIVPPKFPNGNSIGEFREFREFPALGIARGIFLSSFQSNCTIPFTVSSPDTCIHDQLAKKRSGQGVPLFIINRYTILFL